MIGRQVILTNRGFTLEELYDFMRTHWDVNEGGEFVLGRPTKASIEEYILHPDQPDRGATSATGTAQPLHLFSELFSYLYWSQLSGTEM